MDAFHFMSRLNTITILVIGCIALIKSVNHFAIRSRYARKNKLLIDITLFIIYILFCGLVVLFYIYMGYNLIVIYGALWVVVMIMLVVFLRTCIIHRDSMHLQSVVLFLIYFVILLYLTIFMRLGSVDTSIVTAPFDDLWLAIQRQDMQLVEHMVLNVVLFLPFGYLISAMNPRHFRHWSLSLFGGLMVSTVIESIQMIFSLGQADVDDIIANTLGAVIGYVLIRFVWQFNKNWKL